MARARPKLTPKKRLTVATVTEQLQSAFGNISAVASVFGVTRAAVYGFIEDHPELKAVLKDARETLLDDAESSLHAAVLGSEGWAVCFALKCLGKERGYVERQEITGANGGGVEIIVKREKRIGTTATD